jgi:hypothetical protein
MDRLPNPSVILAPAPQRVGVGARVSRLGVGRCSVPLWFVIGGLSLVVAGCGKKGPPIAPIVRIPAQVDTIAARRVGSEIYVTLTVPKQNIDASVPADVSKVEVFGYTGQTPPSRARWAALATLVGTVPVMPAPRPGEAAPPAEPGTGAVQGGSATIVDALTDDELVQGRVDPPLPAGRGAPPPVVVASVPTVPLPLRRFYLAIPFSPRGRPGPPGTATELPLADIPEPPANATVRYDPMRVSVEWQPSGGLLGFLLDREFPRETPPFDEPTSSGASPAAIAGPQGPTRYNVYVDVAPDPVGMPAPTPKTTAGWRAALPAAANPMPLAALTFSDALEFERERCYSVRAIRSGVESDASARLCVRPVDVYPPPAPAAPEAVAGEGVISLIWEPSSAIDLGGYLVLRGEPGDATLLALTPHPIAEASYRDTTVVAGRRYAYAIVAVDDRVPLGNVSNPSPRVEETAR